MDARLTHILEKWYLTEPALFLVCCTHKIVCNNQLTVPMRCGKGLIEYSGEILQQPDDVLEEYLKAETIRILLKHPYERQPENCSPKVCACGSNLVLGDNYTFNNLQLPLPQFFEFPENQSFEWYCRHLPKENNPKVMLICLGQKTDGGSDSQNGKGSSTSSSSPSSSGSSAETMLQELAENWDEDTGMQCKMEQTVEQISQSNSWGSLSGNLQEKIESSWRARVDFRQVLMGFRASILSSNRSQTRMRPSRRGGFDFPGWQYEYTTRLLIAIDCSESVNKETLGDFLSVINRIFRYGIQQVDVTTFDTRMHEVITLKAATNELNVTGRGGTKYQQVIDYVAEHNYDGVVILTDGIAPKPQIPFKARHKLAWVLCSQELYNNRPDWMSETGRCCYMEL